MAEKGKGNKENHCPGCNQKLPVGAVCEWCEKMWKCNQCNRWLKVAEHKICPTCTAREDRQDARAQAEHTRKVGFAHCKDCDHDYPVADGGCKVCTLKCPKCKERYSKKEAACPRCPKAPKPTYRLEVLTTEGEHEWHCKATIYRELPGEVAKAVPGKVEVYDRTIRVLDAASSGLEVELAFERHHRVARFSVELVKDGRVQFNPNIHTQEINLPGRSYDKCRKPITPEAGKGFWGNLGQAFKKAWNQNR
ncbi:MAG: hypothetical protein PHI63_02715 [Patescibacteria group bacterium]|nr:hypothetical protein [Patescibacteria group bacterium]